MSADGGNNSGGGNGLDDERNSNGKRVHTEETYTLNEVFEHESHLEETANAVLGASDNKNCSYKDGYVRRQALYACLTCTPPSDPNFKPAGICLACSLHCHDGHDLVELYTKRNFRCDCGTIDKFPSTTCKLEPMKEECNTNNSYNHNFQGLYCTCNRPYPDPEDYEIENADDDEEQEEDEMIQCVICEDWYHGRHIKNSFDFRNDEFSEFICESCTKKCDFLGNYGHLLNHEPETETGADHSVDVVGDEGLGSSSPMDESASASAETATIPTQNAVSAEVDDATSQDSGTVTSVASDTPEDDASQAQAPICLLNDALKEKKDLAGGTWWISGWREKLCKCQKCLEKYKTLEVEFLSDYEDTLAAYEALGKEKAKTREEETTEQAIQRLLSKLDRVGQIEFIHGVNELKTELEKFLRGIAETGREVTEEDILTFFAELTNKRRRRTADVYIPATCR